MKKTLTKVALFVCAFTCATWAFAQDKEQKITFLAGDGQAQQFTKVYELKHAKAVDLLPFVKTAIKKSKSNSTVSAVADVQNNRQLLIVTTKKVLLETADQLISVLDRPCKPNANGSIISGTGAVCGTYNPQYRGNKLMRDIIVDAGVSSPAEEATVEFDAQSGKFYFKDTPFLVEDIKQKLAWLDRPVPQARVEFTVYELHDSELRDIGIDYLAWKNGPGLNLFDAGYTFMTNKIAETLIQSGTDVFGSFAGGFGGIYTAPAFDQSFIRLLQQHGKAVVNSTASVTVKNEENRVFSTSFAPEYQNIQKDEDYKSSVSKSIAGSATLTADVSNVVITAGKDGVVNLTCDFTGSNVIGRNNLGAEIVENDYTSTSVGLKFDETKILANWVKTSEVEQTIGVPFLCELPILKYIFGTTTKNQETTYYVVTAKAVPLNITGNDEPGIVQEFDAVVKK